MQCNFVSIRAKLHRERDSEIHKDKHVSGESQGTWMAVKSGVTSSVINESYVSPTQQITFRDTK